MFFFSLVCYKKLKFNYQILQEMAFDMAFFARVCLEKLQELYGDYMPKDQAD